MGRLRGRWREYWEGRTSRRMVGVERGDVMEGKTGRYGCNGSEAVKQRTATVWHCTGREVNLPHRLLEPALPRREVKTRNLSRPTLIRRVRRRFDPIVIFSFPIEQSNFELLHGQIVHQGLSLCGCFNSLTFSTLVQECYGWMCVAVER
jgi:hypothetical protein